MYRECGRISDGPRGVDAQQRLVADNGQKRFSGAVPPVSLDGRHPGGHPLIVLRRIVDPTALSPCIQLAAFLATDFEGNLYVCKLAIAYRCRDGGRDDYELGMTLSAPKICSYGSSSSPTDSGMS
jgi:hypothetical protein